MRSKHEPSAHALRAVLLACNGYDADDNRRGGEGLVQWLPVDYAHLMRLVPMLKGLVGQSAVSQPMSTIDG